MDIQKIIGYEKLDNILTGFFLGILAILGLYYGQIEFYNTENLGSYSVDFKIPFLKRSLLGGLVVFLILNYLDKLYALRGVLLAVLVVGLYLVFKMFLA